MIYCLCNKKIRNEAEYIETKTGNTERRLNDTKRRKEKKRIELEQHVAVILWICFLQILCLDRGNFSNNIVVVVQHTHTSGSAHRRCSLTLVGEFQNIRTCPCFLWEKRRIYLLKYFYRVSECLKSGLKFRHIRCSLVLVTVKL